MSGGWATISWRFVRCNDLAPPPHHPTLKKNKINKGIPHLLLPHAATSSPEHQHPSGARVNPPERWTDVARRACRRTSRLHCDTSTKTRMRLGKAADPDSSNLVTQALTDALWGDAVICLDRHCSAGSHRDERDKQCGQKWHMAKKKSRSRTTAAAWGQVCVCLGLLVAPTAPKFLLKVKNSGNHCYLKMVFNRGSRLIVGTTMAPVYGHQPL